MKPLPINPNVVSPIVTLKIRTVAFSAGAKGAAQIARNSAGCWRQTGTGNHRLASGIKVGARYDNFPERNESEHVERAIRLSFERAALLLTIPDIHQL